MHRPLSFVALALCTLASPATLAECITLKMIEEDARLTRPVTVHATRVAVGDLLDELSKQSGVLLRAGERDGAEDAQLFISANKTSLGDILNGIWSLLGYQDAEYHFARTGEPGKYRYTLERPLGARNLSLRFLNLAQALFEKHAEKMLAAVEAEPRDRERIIRSMINEIFGADERLTKGLLASERAWSGLAAFAEAFPPGERLRVLRGERGTVRVPTEKLSEKGLAFVRSVWEKAQAVRKRPDGTTEAVPMPSWVQFHVFRGITREVSPTLYIEMESIGGYGYLGGLPLERAVRKKVGELWRLDGDSPLLSATDVPIAPLEKPQEVTDTARALEVRLLQLSESTSIPILGRLPHDTLHDPGQPSRSTLQAYSAKLSEIPPHLQWKWRGKVLLADYPAWFHDETAIVPHRIVRMLRRSQQENDGYLAARDLFAAVQVLSRDQLVRLGDEFPEMNNAAELREVLLALCPDEAALNRLTSAGGVPLTAELVEILGRSVYLQEAIKTGAFRAIRLVEVDHSDRKPPVREYLFGLITREGTWRPALGFKSPKWLPPRPAPSF